MHLRLHEFPLRTQFVQSSAVMPFVRLLQSQSLKTGEKKNSVRLREQQREKWLLIFAEAKQ